jgi:hypothetical protein
MKMTDKEIELKLQILYEKTLRLNLFDYLEWQDNKESLTEQIQEDILELYKYFLNKPNKDKTISINH